MNVERIVSFYSCYKKIGTSVEQSNLCLWHDNAACNITMQCIVITVGCGDQLYVWPQGAHKLT
jgi:hypothetical protein